MCFQRPSSKVISGDQSTAVPRSRQMGVSKPRTQDVPIVLVPPPPYKITKSVAAQALAPAPSKAVELRKKKSPVTDNSAQDLTKAEASLLTSTDPTHILNAQCTKCAEAEVTCPKVFNQKACGRCNKKRARCSITGEMRTYWVNALKKQGRSRSRSQSRSHGPRRPAVSAPDPPASESPSATRSSIDKADLQGQG